MCVYTLVDSYGLIVRMMPWHEDTHYWRLKYTSTKTHLHRHEDTHYWDSNTLQQRHIYTDTQTLQQWHKGTWIQRSMCLRACKHVCVQTCVCALRLVDTHALSVSVEDTSLKTHRHTNKGILTKTQRHIDKDVFTQIHWERHLSTKSY